jgi:hypothetical protein
VRSARTRPNAGFPRERAWTDVKPLVRRHLGDVGVAVGVYGVCVKGARDDEGLG